MLIFASLCNNVLIERKFQIFELVYFKFVGLVRKFFFVFRVETVRVFDLRKTAKLKEFTSPGSTVHKVRYDYSGQYLAAAGPGSGLLVYDVIFFEIFVFTNPNRGKC